jgi:hypothetical protein
VPCAAQYFELRSIDPYIVPKHLRRIRRPIQKPPSRDSLQITQMVTDNLPGAGFTATPLQPMTTQQIAEEEVPIAFRVRCGMAAIAEHLRVCE